MKVEEGVGGLGTEGCGTRLQGVDLDDELGGREGVRNLRRRKEERMERRPYLLARVPNALKQIQVPDLLLIVTNMHEDNELIS